MGLLCFHLRCILLDAFEGPRTRCDKSSVGTLCLSCSFMMNRDKFLDSQPRRIRFGVIITNRDRPEPLRACLTSLSAQTSPPAWVVLADLGSAPTGARTLANLAVDFGVSLLRIEYEGAWNQALAFNTALRHMPPVTHAIQLDADMIMHPALLEIAGRALARCAALAVVPSYIEASAMPDRYDGTLTAFRRLAATGTGGHPFSRGGCTVLPRNWLIENRGYDEAYVGWGFEDADIWHRIRCSHHVYCDDSGSLLLHQSHPRQPDATNGSAGSNRARYRRRLTENTNLVNPDGWGLAPVGRIEVRPAIRPAGHPIGDNLMLPDVPVRRRERDRLRPAPPDRDDRDVSSFRAAAGPEVAQSGGITVALVVHEPNACELVVAIRSLMNQTEPPASILLVDRGSTAESARRTSALLSAYPSACYLRCGAHPPTAEPRAINTALRSLHQRVGATLLLGGPQFLAPGALGALGAAARRGPCFLHGSPHGLPSIVSELDLLDQLPWWVFCSIAALDDRVRGWWQFADAHWLMRHGLYDERLGDFGWIEEALRRARRAQDAEVLAWPSRSIVSLTCTPQEVRRAPPPGSVEATLRPPP